jgi:hypothetical protein
MATVKQVVGSRTSLTTSALNSLASATFVSAGTITHNTNQPLDVLVEVTATPGTVSGNKQLVVFAKISLDGTNFTSGPESGTTTTDEPDLFFVGTVPLNTNSTAQTKTFSLAAALGGVLPYASKIIVKNDSGAALNASGGSVYYSEISATVS